MMLVVILKQCYPRPNPTLCTPKMGCDIKVFCIFVAKNKINHVKLYLKMHSDFKERLLAHSESACWEKAKEEWVFENVFYTEERVSCLCTDYPLQNVCVISNNLNKNTRYICSSCANEFLDIDIADKVFASVAKLKGDLSKSVSRDVFEFMCLNINLSMPEIEFYLSAMRKHKLSERQMNYRKIINKKLIDCISYETYLTFSRIWSILMWAENNSWYDTGYVESVKRGGEKKGLFSKRQIEVIDEIFIREVLNNN